MSKDRDDISLFPLESGTSYQCISKQEQTLVHIFHMFLFQNFYEFYESLTVKNDLIVVQIMVMFSFCGTNIDNYW